MGIAPLLGSAAGIWLWDKYGKEITDNALETFKEQWKRIKWRKAADRYRARLIEKHSTMRVFAKKQSVPLHDYYVDLFVLGKPVAIRRYAVEQLLTSFKKFDSFQSPDKRSSALRIASQYNRLFILGKPGAGKTTLLKYLTTLAIENKIDKIPIFISLNDWALTGKDLLQYIAGEFETCGFPDPQSFILAMLKRGDGMMLFDSLDEVSEKEGKRDKILHDIDNFMFQHRSEGKADNKYFITCRTATSNYIFEREPFVYVEVADLAPEQALAFIRKWFSHSPSKGEFFWEEIKKKEYRNLLELTQNPLLLGLLCLSFDENSRFPTSREQLYREAIDAHLNQWDESKGIKRDEIYRDLSLEAKRHLLAYLAYTFFEDDQIFVPQKTLTREISNFLKPIMFFFEIDINVVVKAMESQHGLLIERAYSIYSFSHLTFQEYFTAQYIINIVISDLQAPEDSQPWSTNESRQSVSNSIEKRWQRFLNAHIKDSRWYEVFRVVASLLPTQDANIFFLCLLGAVNGILRTDKRICNVTEEYSALGYTDKDISMLDLTRELGLDDLAQTLEQLEISQSKKSLKYWGVLSAILYKMGTKYHDVGTFLIRRESAKACLRDYMQANILLVNCLQLSASSLQEEIKGRLLIPPSLSSSYNTNRPPTSSSGVPPRIQKEIESNKTAEKTNHATHRVESPIAQSVATYVQGDDLYDKSFNIGTPSGKFSGKYGIDVVETIGVGESKKVTAFKLWLFDKNDITTASKILISHVNMNQELEVEGELFLITRQQQIILETNAMRMLATVPNLEYGKIQGINYFERVTLELAIWSKK